MQSMRFRHSCNCLGSQDRSEPWRQPRFHAEVQDTECDAWKRLVDFVDEAARDQREKFAPATVVGLDEWTRIATLPRTIAKLKAVKVLQLYGSSLVRIPSEIGEMTALEEFDPYTSYRLHWFPYEITRCARLTRSRVSTRALYGNYKFRAPFPQLPQQVGLLAPAQCSVCQGPFSESGPHQCWISLRVATDVLPLLVHACSDECIDRLPPPAEGYVRAPHNGGLSLRQPAAED